MGEKCNSPRWSPPNTGSDCGGQQHECRTGQSFPAPAVEFKTFGDHQKTKENLKKKDKNCITLHIMLNIIGD